MKETYFYKKLSKKKTRCGICHHFCLLKEGQIGKCGVRKNIDGVLYLTSYGKLSAFNVDPIEKKPFFHFLPGSKTLSLAGEGCSFFCKNCQNWELSQKVKSGRSASGQEVKPEEVVAIAQQKNTPSISYTYTDPTSYYEYTLDTMRTAKEAGLKNCFVSHGFMSSDSAKEAVKCLDAINIDIKSFSEDFYRENCKAKLQPVLDNTRFFKQSGVWVEITTLLIPTLCDGKKTLTDIANFIYQELGRETPWHVTAFSGKISQHLKDIPDTPEETLEMAYQIGVEAGLKYVYAGNTTKYQNTYCSKCDAKVVTRDDFSVKRYDDSGRCYKCNYNLDLCL